MATARSVQREGRRGGRASRREARNGRRRSMAWPVLDRTVPVYEVLSEDRLEALHQCLGQTAGRGRHRLSGTTKPPPCGRRPAPTSTGPARAHPGSARDGAGGESAWPVHRSRPKLRSEAPKSAAIRWRSGRPTAHLSSMTSNGERRYGTLEDLNGTSTNSPICRRCCTTRVLSPANLSMSAVSEAPSAHHL